MNYKTLVDVNTLRENLNNSNWIVIDSRFSLAKPDLGNFLYRHGHIPNARYAHINNDLSSQITSQTGRHPLPNFEQFAKKIGAWGISNKSQVVVYDDASGAFAARLWWLLRYLGHENVAILDGGFQQWQAFNYEITTILPKIGAQTFRVYPSCGGGLTAPQLEDELARKKVCLIDARTPERYRGEQEPIDPIAGHIPYALNRPFQKNLNYRGLFLSPEQLREQFLQLLGDFLPNQTVHYCGSGVTACHNLLAMEHAGLAGSKLYAGSWSEWIVNKKSARGESIMETIELAFEQMGEKNNPPLLILHGFFASARNWRQVAEKLAAEFCVYVLDARNHGNSPHDEIMNYSAMAADILQFIERQQLTTVTLLAHSMGGKTAMWFALNYPNLVENLIVVDIAPVAYTHSFNKLIQALKDLPLAELSNRKQAENLLINAIPDLTYRQFLLQNLVLKNGHYEWRIDLDIFYNQSANVVSFPNTTELSPFTGRTLFIAGQQSRYIPAHSTEILFPTAQIVVIENADHWVHVQQPQAFLKTVNEFLKL